MKEHRKTVIVRARVSPQLKDEVKGIPNKLGVTSSRAITMYLSQAVLRNGLPFEAILPSKMDQAESQGR